MSIRLFSESTHVEEIGAQIGQKMEQKSSRHSILIESVSFSNENLIIEKGSDLHRGKAARQNQAVSASINPVGRIGEKDGVDEPVSNREFPVVDRNVEIVFDEGVVLQLPLIGVIGVAPHYLAVDGRDVEPRDGMVDELPLSVVEEELRCVVSESRL
jgi:hypothetical protein